MLLIGFPEFASIIKIIFLPLWSYCANQIGACKSSALETSSWVSICLIMWYLACTVCDWIWSTTLFAWFFAASSLISPFKILIDFGTFFESKSILLSSENSYPCGWYAVKDLTATTGQL